MEATDFPTTKMISSGTTACFSASAATTGIKHAEFRDKEGIGVELLSDAEGDICKLYGVWQAKRKWMGTRSTVRPFDIRHRRRGTIRHALQRQFQGHALALRLVKELNS